jgi:hypothetical protein
MFSICSSGSLGEYGVAASHWIHSRMPQTSLSITSGATPSICPATTESAVWAQGTPINIYTEPCIEGWGNLARICTSSGWTVEIGVCKNIAEDISPLCPEKSEGNATWPAGQINDTFVLGKCNAGFTGVVFRSCDSEGWGNIMFECTPESEVNPLCPSKYEEGALWRPGSTGTTQVGLCIPELETNAESRSIRKHDAKAVAFRSCTVDGWGPITGSCSGS